MYLNDAIYKKLDDLLTSAPKLQLNQDSRIVIFSDLHIGNKGMNDDFQRNSELFSQILLNHYLPRNYQLILNGDVEELYKFRLRTVEKVWKPIYDIFSEFKKQTGFYKIIGNHDYLLRHKVKSSYDLPLYEAINLLYNDNSVFVYHGHQTANTFERYSLLVHFLIKYLFRTVSNTAVSMVNNKKFLTESIAYEFAKSKKIISILGHTHRPVFESLSKIEAIKFNMESLLKMYHKSQIEDTRTRLERQIKILKRELELATNNNHYFDRLGNIYGDEVVVPCLFNSGAVTGKRGITGLEIKNGKIRLVYWFDKNKSQRYMEDFRQIDTLQLGETDYYRAILKKANLDFIFTRINLLS